MEPDIIVVDGRFKSCPGPLIALADAVAKASPGQVVKLLATDPAAPSDVKEWCAGVGHRFLGSVTEGDVYAITIEVAG
jgi:tRNA 2-thiouridine synthesizing protein A